MGEIGKKCKALFPPFLSVPWNINVHGSKSLQIKDHKKVFCPHLNYLGSILCISGKNSLKAFFNGKKVKSE